MPAAARAERAGCRGPPRGCDPRPARRADPAGLRPAASARQPHRDRGRRARLGLSRSGRSSPARIPKSERDWIDLQAPGHEAEHLGGGLVQPLGIIDIHSTGCSSASADSRLSTARPTINRSGGSPRRSPSATSRASACGAGRPGIRSSAGPHSGCRPAKLSSRSASTPHECATPKPAADWAA